MAGEGELTVAGAAGCGGRMRFPVVSQVACAKVFAAVGVARHAIPISWDRCRPRSQSRRTLPRKRDSVSCREPGERGRQATYRRWSSRPHRSPDRGVTEDTDEGVVVAATVGRVSQLRSVALPAGVDGDELAVDESQTVVGAPAAGTLKSTTLAVVL